MLSEIWEGVGEGKERVERIRKDKEKGAFADGRICVEHS